jgi:CheY-like chemotaxis protein
MVEDNPGDQFLLAELLTSAGFNKDSLLTAPSFAEAVDILKSQPVDITLLDLSLPDSEGIETFINIKALVAEKPVIILSGTTNTQLALDAITMGAQDYLIKGDFDESGNPIWTKEGLLVDSVRRFKGQAAPAVIFTECDFESFADINRKLLFVGITRARIHLEWVISSNLEKLIEQRLM